MYFTTKYALQQNILFNKIQCTEGSSVIQSYCEHWALTPACSSMTTMLMTIMMMMTIMMLTIF